MNRTNAVTLFVARRLALCALVATALLGGPGPALAAPATARTSTVVVVLAPFLTWSDLSQSATPALYNLAETGAIANMNALTADKGWPTVAGGALTLGAGRWAAMPPGVAAVPSSLPAIRAYNADSLAVPQLGALGDALGAAGVHAIAIGNGDESIAKPAGVQRPAALAAMDGHGSVADETGLAMLKQDAGAPYGVRADTDAIVSAASDVLARSSAASRTVVVVDPGDLARAHDDPDQSMQQSAVSHTAAVDSLDAVVDGIRQSLPEDGAILVVAQTTDKPYYEPPYFGPIIAHGPGFGGDLTSASTHRTELVSNLDVAPTVLDALGIAQPATMIGQPMTSRPAAAVGAAAAPLMTRLGDLSRIGTTVGAVDFVRDRAFIALYVGVTLAVLALAVALALLPLASVRFVGRWWLLLVLSVPPSAWLLFVVERWPATPGRVGAALGVATFVVFAVALALDILVRRRPTLPLLALATLTSVVICADQWLGHPLESGLFSYSVRAGWRYYGMGNEGSALLVGASLAAIGLACDLAAETPVALPLRRFGIPVVGAVALFTAASPTLGANAGVAVWGLVAFAVAWFSANRVRFTWKTVAATLLGIALLVGALVAIDLARGSGGETHLGRFFSEITSGSFGEVWELVRRKAINAWNYLPQTPYTWLALAFAAALALVRWVRPRPLVSALAERPAYAGALLGVVVGSVVALFTEDSGTVMPALMLLAGATPALYLALLPARKDAS